VKDVLAPLRLVCQPTDEIAFVRMLGLLPRTGERTARKIWEKIGRRFTLQNPDDLAASAARCPRRRGRTGDAGRLPARGRGRCGRRGSRGRFVEALYRRYATETFDNADRRMEDIDEMVRYLSRYPSLADFLNEVALLTNVDTGGARPAAETDGDSLLLSTVHQAKGLEWPVVFVLWMAEGIFPSGRSMNDEASGGLSEERRLFYVATTRAKDRLFLCTPKLRRGGTGT
jgi:DNA helicase-2/ATP-dependent DNA helicase PcrA